MHAEATSEKMGMGRYLDGRVSAVVGSHTHVQTADEMVLPKGTAFITDTGMCGPLDSVIGMRTDQVLKRFVDQLPIALRRRRRARRYCRRWRSTSTKTTGRARGIRRIREVLEGAA